MFKVFTDIFKKDFLHNFKIMELENKIKCVLMDFEINEITLQEATKQILLLLDVVGQSKQLKCMLKHTDGNCDCGIGSCIEFSW